VARAYSHKAFPHRLLFDTGDNAQRGDDVKVVRRHTLRRLEARNIQRTVGPNDGELYPDLIKAAKTAGHFLGVPEDWTESDSGLLIREQKVIVYPASRTETMLHSAELRMRAMLEEREEKAEEKLDSQDRIRARRIAVAAFALAYRNREVVHYTQGATRWQGINERRRYADGRYPNYADCSSMASWCLWNALTNVVGSNIGDVVNGANWQAGYTGTMLTHGIRVDNRMPGDCVFYGRGWPGSHVAMVANDTDMVYSHGSEAGPYYVRWNYRSDVMQTRRYIL
jgi:hypothetical protein